MFGQSEKEEAEIDRVLSLADQPVNINTARKLIAEIKKIMDDNNVSFFLRQGTCLGAIRNGDLIPWDDDIDIGSIYGLHGFEEQQIATVIPDMQKKGFLTRISAHNDYYKCVTFVKGSMRIDWGCYWEINSSIIMYPAIPIPMRLFESLKEIELLGRKYLVPNPPEEYLCYKYGEDWRTPKQTGEYEGDVLDIILKTHSIGLSIKYKQFLAKILPWWSKTKVHIVDQEKKPVSGVRVFIAGLGIFKSNKKGIVKFYIPRCDLYAFRFEVNGEEYILYMETLHPDASYIYQLGSEHFTSDTGYD
ncbi:LicD family protein [Chloroflexota bacterium]